MAVREARQSGLRPAQAARALGLSARTLQRWQAGPVPSQRRRGEPVGAKPDTSFAQQPNSLWCRDITQLRTTQPWVCLHLSVLLDWVSRKVLAWPLAETLESRELLPLWDQGLQNEGLLEVPPHVYPRSLPDRGTQMRSRLTRRFFARTGVGGPPRPQSPARDCAGT